MAQRIRKVGFANVISVIALSVAIGGGAYAADKINGKTLKTNSVGAKKLKCPAVAKKRTVGLCYTDAQPAAGWIAAAQQGCVSKGLRLPTSGEALLVLTKTGGESWADDIIVEGLGGLAARVQGGTVFATAIAEAHAYHCVTVVS